MDLNLDQLLKEMVEQNASDLHIAAGNPPIMRLKGKLTRLKGYPSLTSEQAELMLINILTGFQNEKLFEEKELDFSYNVPDLARFRGNIFRENKALGGVFRMIPHTPRSIDEIGIPPVIKDLSQKRYGMILVTGPSGSGKTTTLAAVIDHMNRTRNSHIVTIEDPIEYVFQNRTCLIRQREVGTHTNNFTIALKSALRQDPDVIFVGEIRDKETIDTALTAAETGHLVISTLHTNNSVDTVGRIIDIFPGHQQQQIKIQLSSTLQGVFSQLLIPHKKRERGLVLATEVLVVTNAIRNLIREGKIHMIRSAIEMGNEHGMQTMEQSLKKLYDEGKISIEEALGHAFDLESMNQLLGINKKASSQESREPGQPTGTEQHKQATAAGAGAAASSPFKRMSSSKTESGSQETPKNNKIVSSGGYVIDDGQSHYARDPLYTSGSYYASPAISPQGSEEDDDF